MIVINPAIKQLIPAVFSLLLGGCVSVPNYPENWAQGFPEHNLLRDKPGENCSLSGSYANAGESPQGQDSGAPISLLSVLFPSTKLSAATTPDRITLQGPEGGALKVTMWKDGKPVEVKLLDNYVCLENGLVMINLRRGARGSADCVVTICTEDQDNFLYRGKDGWLILKRLDLTVVLPWFKWVTSWYRFRSMDHPENTPSLQGK